MKKLNKSFRLNEVIVINDDKTQSKMRFLDALLEAEEKQLDLVQVNNTNDPVICKFLNFGKMMYDNSKREKSNKQKDTGIKEIKLRPTISNHDLETKVRIINEFLEKKNKVKISMQFRGRMVTRRQVGIIIMKKLQSLVKGSLERETQEERNVSMLFAP